MDSSMDPSEDDGGMQQPDVHKLLKIVILSVIGFVSVTGNLIAIGTLIFYRRVLRTPIYIVIGGLALADVIVTMMKVPESVIYELDKGDVKSTTWCKVYAFLFNSCEYIAAFHLVVLAVFRGILLTDRAHHGPKVIHTAVTSVIIWIAVLLANIPVINMSVLELISHQCVVDFNERGSSISASIELYTLLSAAFSYFLPLILMFIIYIVTGYMSKRFFEDSYSQRERRLSKMITYLILSFAFCRLPSEMVDLLFFYQMKSTDMQTALSRDRVKLTVWMHVKQYLEILSMLDMAFRPIIYATMSREFGTVYDKIINCKYCKQEDEVMPPRLRRRGEEIEEVLHTPLRQNPAQDDCVNETEEIF